MAITRIIYRILWAEKTINISKVIGMTEIDFTPLKKAIAVFEEFRTDMVTHRDKAGAVQAFEFCYELSWKMMQRVLKNDGQESGSPKDVFRKAQKLGIIDSAESWFDFQSLRNITSHTYNIKSLEDVIVGFEAFSNALNMLIKNLEEFA